MAAPVQSSRASPQRYSWPSPASLVSRPCCYLPSGGKVHECVEAELDACRDALPGGSVLPALYTCRPPVTGPAWTSRPSCHHPAEPDAPCCLPLLLPASR